MIPVLYSFRRCPFAMRARMAVSLSKQSVILREVVLRDKPQQLLDASPSATVPCLITQNGIISESLDIMKWALEANDPLNLLEMPDRGWQLIEEADGPFKQALDRTKYSARYPAQDLEKQRKIASDFLTDIDQQIDHWIFDEPSIADFAILPFVRQFAFIDKDWFDAQPWSNVHGWLKRFLHSEEFERIMPKYAQWREGDKTIMFPDETDDL